MNSSERLEDLLPAWRKACTFAVSAGAAAIADAATKVLPPQVDLGNAGQRLAITDAVESGVRSVAADTLLPDCLTWLAGQGDAVKNAPVVAVDIGRALRLWSLSVTPFLPLATQRVPDVSLAFTALAGAVLGCLALTPLSLLLLGQRELGLLLGGAAGAAAAVGLVSWLSHRSEVLDTLQKVVGTAGLIAALGGVVNVFRGRSLGLLKTAGWIFGCWLVLVVARPRITGPSRGSCREALVPQVERILAHATDLVLALCWSHPERAARAAGVAAIDRPADLPESLVVSLGVLNAVFEGEATSTKHVQGAVRAVLQQVRKLGYEWQSVPTGTPYATALDERFECFDEVTLGQPVETLEPAVVCEGKVKQRGKLRSFQG